MFIHDIAVFSGDNKPVLLIEVKTLAKDSSTWASELARFILEKTEMKGAGAFLLATPKKWFFFQDVTQGPIELDASSLVKKRFPSNLQKGVSISHAFLEGVVWDALEELLIAKTPPKGLEDLWGYLSSNISGSSRMESQVSL